MVKTTKIENKRTWPWLAQKILSSKIINEPISRFSRTSLSSSSSSTDSSATALSKPERRPRRRRRQQVWTRATPHKPRHRNISFVVVLILATYQLWRFVSFQNLNPRHSDARVITSWRHCDVCFLHFWSFLSMSPSAKLQTRDTRLLCKVKCHCMADRLFDWFGFNRTS